MPDIYQKFTCEEYSPEDILSNINKAKVKTDLETCRRMLRLKWYFQNYEKEFDRNKFEPIPTFNPKNKGATIETYLSSLEEKLMNIEIPQNKYNNTTERSKVSSLLLALENT